MGMYTEILIKADIKEDLPLLVEAVLQHLFNGATLAEDELPDHPFFRCSRWQHVGRMSSCYHIPWSDSKYDERRIFSRSDLKNYEGEIEAFFDWLMPYVDDFEGKCIGYHWYEEADAPTLVYLQGRA